MIDTNRPISPALMNMLKKQYPTQVQNVPVDNGSGVQQSYEYNPMVSQTALAMSKQIVPASQVAGVTEAQARVPGYKNDLKDMLTSNKARILAVIPRTMNAQDSDGNGLIQSGEKSGTFVNAVERLDEMASLGFNTQHVLPINPPGKTKAFGTAGSLYAPSDFLSLDPELVDENPPEEARKEIEKLYEQKTGKKLEKMDKNDPEVVFAQCKYYIDECHKRGIKVMLDLPSCASVDYSIKHPEMMAVDSNGKEKIPQGWQDIRMLKPFENEQTRTLNNEVLDVHKKFVDMCIDLGFDGVRADVGRAKPVEFWNVIINYSRAKDPEFAWLAETYTHEDASPQLNMPYDRPQELLEVGFDAYYGQYHIFNQWTKNEDLYKYVKENIDLNNKIGEPKALIGSFATHDDYSPMLYGGPQWVMFTTILQSMLPQVNPYMVDGAQSGDTYIYPYKDAIVENSETDNNQCFVHAGKLDIFNKSRKPGGNHPEISNIVRSAFALRGNKYNETVNNSVRLEMQDAQDVITKGSFIILPTNNPEIISFARHKDGKTLVFIGNRNVNKTVGGTITIPGLSPDQKFRNLMPNYGEECKFQNNQNGSVNVELGASRACVFEIDDKDIQTLSNPENVMQQEYLK